MNNLHISLTEFRNESRVLKEVNSLKNSNIFEKVYIAALYGQDTDEYQTLSDGVFLKRFILHSRNWSRNFIVQLYKYLEFSFKVWNEYKDKNINVINVHALSLLPLGIILKSLFKAKLVYDTHELETEKNGLTGFRKKISKILEKKLIRNAELVFVVSESIADWYMNEYNISRPTVILNAPQKQTLPSCNHFREKFNIQPNQLILLYQGGLMKGRGVHLILDAFKQRSGSEVVAVFMGYGELEEEIKRASQKSNNIFFYPAVSPHIVLEYTSSADIGVSLIENTCLSYYYCMPNKLFEYAMAGLPIIVSNMKDMSEIVNKNHMGMVIEDFSPTGINSAINSLLQQDFQTLKSNAYITACNNSWEIQENKMLSAYKTMFKINP